MLKLLIIHHEQSIATGLVKGKLCWLGTRCLLKGHREKYYHRCFCPFLVKLCFTRKQRRNLSHNGKRNTQGKIHMEGVRALTCANQAAKILIAHVRLNWYHTNALRQAYITTTSVREIALWRMENIIYTWHIEGKVSGLGSHFCELRDSCKLF